MEDLLFEVHMYHNVTFGLLMHRLLGYCPIGILVRMKSLQ